jgi:hypothetical protein
VGPIDSVVTLFQISPESGFDSQSWGLLRLRERTNGASKKLKKGWRWKKDAAGEEIEGSRGFYPEICVFFLIFV